MGNRAFISLKQKEKRQAYYVHWNGGPDTIFSMFNCLKENNFNHIETIEKAFEAATGQKMEKTNAPTSETEENGHYVLNLDNFSCVYVQEKYNKKTEHYDKLSFIVTDFHSAVKEYINERIIPEYREGTYKNYWIEFQKTFKEKYLSLLDPEVSLINKWIEESKYCMTKDEVTFLKRKIKSLSCSDFILKVSIAKGRIKTTVEVLNPDLVDNNDLLEFKKSFREDLHDKIKSIVDKHQVCYSQRDSMTDYSGSYRIREYFETEYKLKSEV